MTTMEIYDNGRLVSRSEFRDSVARRLGLVLSLDYGVPSQVRRKSHIKEEAVAGVVMTRFAAEPRENVVVDYCTEDDEWCNATRSYELVRIVVRPPTEEDIAWMDGLRTALVEYRDATREYIRIMRLERCTAED